MRPCHARTTNFALVLLIVFSKGFTPMREGTFLNDGQLVCTVNVAEARRPLVCPAACIVCAPGCADLGTSTGCVKFPALSATAEPAADVSNVRITVSPAVKPEPVAVAFVVGGPAVGDTETVAASANPALAITARVTLNARADKQLRVMARPPVCFAQPTSGRRRECLRLVKRLSCLGHMDSDEAVGNMEVRCNLRFRWLQWRIVSQRLSY